MKDLSILSQQHLFQNFLRLVLSTYTGLAAQFTPTRIEAYNRCKKPYDLTITAASAILADLIRRPFQPSTRRFHQRMPLPTPTNPQASNPSLLTVPANMQTQYSFIPL